MITLTVVSYNATPLAQPLAAHFDETGGNIGRADNNQLVLPDPERTISRVHAQVVFRGGRYALVDRGSNPVSINGRPLGNGQEAPLAVGDEVQIGGYSLRVDAGGPGAGAAAVDPFADFGGLAAAPPARPAARATAASLDPLAAFGMAPSPSPSSNLFPPPPPAAASPSAGGIPDDWDPFAPEPKSSRPDDFARSLGQPPAAGGFGLDVGGRSSSPLIEGLPGSSTGSADSLDALFGLGAGSGGDPFANSALGQAAAQPNMAAHADPLRSLNSVTPSHAQAAADTDSELRTPFMLPPMTPVVPKPAAAAPVVPPPVAAPLPPPAAKGAVLSWDDSADQGRTIIRPKISAGAAAKPIPATPPVAVAPPPPAAPLDLMFDDAPPPVPATPLRAAAPMPASPAPADDAALLAALKEGLAVPLSADRLTPELMRLLGQLVHEATRGTVDLLVARAALKREIRAEVTMIAARENNPLKFSPSVDVALGHLLSPPARGFMPPDQAMRDAYDDLRAHQFGFLAGMRAALEGVLKRFDPQVLEGKLTQKSVLASLLPASRKARMWDVFNELYAQISAEAEDDFHELFGKEFLRAYESYIDQLAKDRF